MRGLAVLLLLSATAAEAAAQHTSSIAFGGRPFDGAAVPRGSWTYDVGRLSSARTLRVADSTVEGAKLIVYTWVHKTRQGDAVIRGRIDPASGVVRETYEGPDGTANAVGSLTDGLVPEQSLAIILSGVTLTEGATLKVSTVTNRPNAHLTDTLAVRSQSAIGTDVTVQVDGRAHRTLILDRTTRALMREDVTMFDGGILSYQRRSNGPR